MSINDNNHYSTSDTSIACYLLTEGFTLIKIDYSLPRFTYEFEDDPKLCKEHERKYLIGEARTDPSVFTRINRKLMRTIKNFRQWDD